MKKNRCLLIFLLTFLSFVFTVEAQKNYYFYKGSNVSFKIPFADIDSITLDPIVELKVDNLTMFNVEDSCRLDIKIEPEGFIGHSDIKWESTNEDVALVRNGYVIPQKEGEAIIKGTFGGRLVTCSVDVVKPVESEIVAGPSDPDLFVDLGLPSGTLWAKCNLGMSKPEEAGDFYAWGEVETKKEFTIKNYKWIDNLSNDYEVACIYNDYNKLLYPVFDVCTHKLGEEFCLPNRDQLNELLGCESRWDTLNGVEGQRFVGPNGNSIFLPAAIMPGGKTLDADYLGAFYKSNLYCSKTFYSDHTGYGNFYDGLLVRPVYRQLNVEKIELNKTKIEMCTGASPVGLRLLKAVSHLGELELKWSSSNNNVATVKNGYVTPVSPGHCVIACSYRDLRSYCEVVVLDCQDTTPVITHEYVDLGLPSGNLWATTNIGADTLTNSGAYFAWGCVTPIYSNACTTCGNMWWGLSNSELMNKNVITKDTILSPFYDAAKYNWGDDWSVPTKADFEELFNICDREFLYINHVAVFKFIGPNGNELILPKAGRLNEQNSHIVGRYWTSTPCENGDSYMFYTCDRRDFNQAVSEMQSSKRGSLIRIRPVMKPNKK